MGEISGQEFYGGIKAGRKTSAVHDSSAPHTKAVKADPIQQQQRPFWPIDFAVWTDGPS